MGGNSGQGNSTISAETFLSPEPAPLLPEIHAALPVRDGFFPLFANWPDRNNRLIFNVFPKECRYFGAGGIFPKSGSAGSKEHRAPPREKTDSEMPEENQNGMPPIVREHLSGDAAEMRADSGGVAPRPLSQFILAKQTERFPGSTGFSANLEPIRPVVMTAPVRQAGTDNPSSGRPARRHSPMRVEYPFYAEGEDELNLDDFPAPETVPPPEPALHSVQTEPAAVPETEVPETAAAEPAAELNPARPASPVRPVPAAASPSFPPSSEPALPPNTPQIYASKVPAAETAVPLHCDRGRAGSLPIFRCYLAAELSR